MGASLRPEPPYSPEDLLAWLRQLPSLRHGAPVELPEMQVTAPAMNPVQEVLQRPTLSPREAEGVRRTQDIKSQQERANLGPATRNIFAPIRDAYAFAAPPGREPQATMPDPDLAGSRIFAGLGQMLPVPLAGAVGMQDVARWGAMPARIGPLYHGSPHQFDKFDSSKIGTGEGAQAYGHGLYFAENPKVAGQYQQKLSSVQVHLDGKPIDPAGDRAADMALAAIEDAALMDSPDPFAAATQWLTRPKWNKGIPAELRPEIGAMEKRAKGFIAKWKADGATVRRGGALYTAELPNVDPEDLLDWDKPLSEQSEKVKKALRDVGMIGDPHGQDWRTYTDAIRADAASQRDGQIALMIAKDMVTGKEPAVGASAEWAWERLRRLAPNVDHNAIHDIRASALRDGMSEKTMGREAYHRLAQLSGDGDASKTLNAAGIKGIRYLDGMSRRKGQGSYNYVVFDDADVNILNRE